MWPKTWVLNSRQIKHADLNSSSPYALASHRATECPRIVPMMSSKHGGSPDSTYVELRGGNAPLYEHGQGRSLSVCAPREHVAQSRTGVPFRGRTAVWSQVVTTVWPPGTVSVLPVGPYATANGDAVDYPWRLNRAHVVSIVSDVPATGVLEERVAKQTAAGDIGPGARTEMHLPIQCRKHGDWA